MKPLPLLLLLLACGPGRLVRKGDAALADGRVSAARYAYRAALERRPEDPRALLGLARALLADGDPEAAIAPARAAAEAGLAQADAVLARALLEGGQGASAGEAAGRALASSPKDLSVRALVAEAALARGDLAAAAAEAEPLTEGGPRALALAAWIQSRAGDLERAAALASRAAATALEDAEVQAEAAAVLALAGEPGGSRAAARAALGLGGSAEQYAKEAGRRDSGGDREGAIRRLSWAAALDPDEGRHQARLGQLYLAQGASERAAALLARALTVPPYRDPKTSGVTVARPDDWPEPTRKQKVAEVLRALSVARAGIGDLRGGASALQEATLLTGGDADAWLAVADAWERARGQDAMVEALFRAVSADASHISARLRLARTLAAMGQLGPAIGHARAAWERDPRGLDATLLLGSLYEQRNEIAAARDLYKTVLRAHPGEKRLTEALQRVGE